MTHRHARAIEQQLQAVERKLDDGSLGADDVRSLVAMVRLAMGDTGTARKSKKPWKGLRPEERRALCDSLNARHIPGPWVPISPHLRGAGVGVRAASGSAFVARTPDGDVTYRIFKEPFDGEHELGRFTGEGWIDRLADAVAARFDALFPPFCGWEIGHRARIRRTGEVFAVRQIIDHQTSIRHYPAPAFIDLVGEGVQIEADACDRVEPEGASDEDAWGHQRATILHQAEP